MVASYQARNQSLDVLRGIAVLVVVAYHFRFNISYNPLSQSGWAGVDLFFVLSGFLVSGLLFREFAQTGRVSIWRFILRRGLKIWPAFYVFVLVTSALMAFSWQGSYPWNVVAHASLFVRNYASGDASLIFKHTWSLDVEEHFYVLLALMFFAAKGRYRFIPALWAFIMIAAAAFRATSAMDTATMASHCRMDSIFTGVFVSYLFHFERQLFARIAASRWAFPTALSGLGIALFAIPPNGLIFRLFTYPLLAMSFALIIVWSFYRQPTSRTAKLVAKIGTYSYSIYLWQFMAAFIAEALNIPAPIRFGFYLGLAISIGVGMSKLVEMPVLRLRDTLIPQTRSCSPLAPAGMSVIARTVAPSSAKCAHPGPLAALPQ